jgi:histone deacetylase 1/2
VAKPTTLRALFAYATKYSCHLKAGDVETAFLTADMDCEVWAKMPPFWGNDNEAIDVTMPTMKPRLLIKGVPGIPQGSRLFFETFSAHLISMGYKPSNADKCLFIHPGLGEKNAIIIWVDDFVFMHERERTFANFMASIRTKFIVPGAASLNSFLGMEIVHDVGAKIMTISQKNSINVLLERAKMNDCNSAITPCVPGFIFTTKDSPSPPRTEFVTEYRSLIALANFVSCWTRPDITYTVNKLCKYMSNPGDNHWRALKHLLRYLSGTREDGLRYDYSNVTSYSVVRQGLYGFTDSSFADCIDTGRSTLAYVFFFDKAVLSWYSKLNSYVTTCTNHSEYNALALGAKEAEWLVLLYNELDKTRAHTPVPSL